MTTSTLNIDELNGMSSGMVKHLGIEFTAIEEGVLKARMPIDERTHQPFGLLHGGATAALAETLGSFGSYLTIDQETQAAVGMEVTAQHLRSATSGYANGIATILHRGRTIHLWDIKVYDDAERLLAVCKLSVMIIDQKK